MRRRYSINSQFYTVPNFEGLSVRERVNLVETLLPLPSTLEQAVERATTGLYAIGIASCALDDQLLAQQEFVQGRTGKIPLQFWSEIAADTESRFQGNINSVLRKKHYKQVELANPCSESDEDYF